MSPLQFIVAMRCTHRNALCHQTYHEGFTAKITVFPNMVCTVNLATEELLRDY